MKFIIGVLILFLTACATGPKPPSYKRAYEPVGAKDYKFSDKNIDLKYIPNTFSSSLTFTLENKSDKPIKVIWDETTFLNSDGTSEKIIHNGVRLIDRNNSQAPSTVPPKAKIEDAITPTSRIVWSGQNWIQNNICGKLELIAFKGLAEFDEECVNKIFGAFFVYEIDGKKSSFTVKFKLIKREEIPSIYY